MPPSQLKNSIILSNIASDSFTKFFEPMKDIRESADSHVIILIAGRRSVPEDVIKKIGLVFIMIKILYTS